MRKQAGIVLLLGVVFALLTILSYLAPMVLWDENAYLANARSHLGQASYTEDFRYPLLEYLVAGIWIVTGESILAARMIMILFYIATVYLFYLLTSRYFEKNLGITAFFAFSYLMIFWGFRVYTDIVALFFLLLSLYLLRKEWVFLAGAVGALAFLTRFTFIIWLAAVILYLLWNREWKKTGMFVVGCLIVLAPWLVYNMVVYQNPLWDFFAQLDIVTRYNTHYSALPFLRECLLYLNLFMMMTVVKLKEILRQEECKLMLLYVLGHIGYFAFVSSVQQARYVTSIIPFVLITGWYGITRVRNTFMKKALIVSIVIIAALFFISVMMVIRREFVCGENNSILQAVAYLKNEKNIDVISNVWPYFGFANNVRVHSFYASVSELSVTHQPKYFIYNKGIGDAYNETALQEALTLVKSLKDACGGSTGIYVRKS